MTGLFKKVRENCKKGIFAPYIEKYLDHLGQTSCSRWRIYHELEHILRFAKYLHKRKVKCLSQISPQDLVNYLSCRNKKFKKKFKRSLQKNYQKIIYWAIKNFLLYLRHQGVIEFKGYFKERPPCPEIITPFLKDYLNFCRVYRGLSPETLKMHRYWIGRLGEYSQAKEIKDFKSLKITDLDGFVLNYTSSLSRGSISVMQWVLRSFLRYLFITGEISRDLSPHILSPKMYRNRLIPKHISREEIELVLKQVDIHAAIGKRDYAILVLLVSYGLRSKEIANLKIKDVEWKEKKLSFSSRKSGDTLILPLKEEVLQAILSYLKFGRPKKEYAQLFLTSTSPMRPLNSSSVSEIARKYIEKAGLNPASKGAHIFRHSLAKHLLDQGVPLTTISKILGHKSIRSTMIYTRISTEQLREVTDNYANLL